MFNNNYDKNKKKTPEDLMQGQDTGKLDVDHTEVVKDSHKQAWFGAKSGDADSGSTDVSSAEAAYISHLQEHMQKYQGTLLKLLEANTKKITNANFPANRRVIAAARTKDVLSPLLKDFSRIFNRAGDTHENVQVNSPPEDGNNNHP